MPDKPVQQQPPAVMISDIGGKCEVDSYANQQIIWEAHPKQRKRLANIYIAVGQGVADGKRTN